MVRFEIKKVLSRTGGKIALLLLLALVLLECSFAFDGTYVNSEGVSTHGIAAVRPLRAEQKKWEGLLDEQRIAQVIGELNRIESLPEAKSEDLIDEEITYSRKQGVSAIRLLLNCSYATGFRDYDYYLADSLTPEQAKDFYPNRIRLLKAWLAGEAKDQFSDEEKQFLIARYEALETPFSYAYNEGWSQLLYVLDPLNATMPIILCFLVAGIFSGEFTTKADAVFYSARYGRNKAVTAKLKAGVLLTTVLYFAAALLLSAIVLTVMGADGADCPIQATHSGWKSLYNWKLWQAWLLGLLGGYVGSLFLSLLTMLISAATRSTVISVMVPFAAAFLPSFLSQTNVVWLDKLLYLLPMNLSSTWTTLRTFSLYRIGGRVVPSLPVLLTLYGIVSACLLPVIYRVYRKQQLK